MNDNQIKRDIEQMEANLRVRETKYIRNYNRYMNNGSVMDQIRNYTTNPPQGYWWNSATPDTGPIPMLNVLKSMVDTLTSKLAETRVRPFFNPVRGDWETRKACRQALQFFDLFFDKEHIYDKSILSTRDALIFEVGHMWVDDDHGTLERVMPWDYLFDRAEAHYHDHTRVAVRLLHYPIAYLQREDWIDAELKGRIVRNPVTKVKLTYYYDLMAQKKSYWVDERKVAEKPINFECSPVASTWYNPPVKGCFSTSMIDNQFTLQTFIDTVAEAVELAVEFTPANFTLLPAGSNLKKSMWSNEIGGVYEYEPQPFVQAQPMINTPAPISPEYLQILQYLTELPYNLEGISQLSAQAKKPAGADSGVALQTLEDVESDRFEVALKERIGFLMRITETAIEVFPEDAEILPKRMGQAEVTWRDVKKQADSFNIQFAPASALSKDPQTKMQEVEKLGNLGIIPKDEMAKYLGFPDTEEALADATTVSDAIADVIDHVIKEGEMQYDLIIPGMQLEQLVVRELLKLRAAHDKTEYIQRLMRFLEIVQENNEQMRAAMAPPPQPAPQPAPQSAPQPQQPAPQQAPPQNVAPEGGPPAAPAGAPVAQ